MNYETFKSSTLTSMQQRFGDNFHIFLEPVRRNNDIHLDGLTILDRSRNIAPTIFLNHYYEEYLDGKPMADVMDEIIDACQSDLPDENFDFTFFTDYEKVKYRFIYRLISYSQNTKLLKDVPHFRFLDLAVVFCCYLPDALEENATILICNEHLDHWQITSELLYETALKNTPMLLPFDLCPMEDLLHAQETVLFESDKLEKTIMYVLSNTQKLYGASVLLYPGLLSHFAELIGSDFYVLPSSVHEVLLFPKDARAHVKDLDCMVQSINRSHLMKEEILSDHVYLFERASGFLTS